jgi:hypothetical protein
MGLQQFERRLERLVEGAFAKAFRSGLQPVEIGRRLTREMDLQRTVAPRGTLTPNHFTVLVGPADRARFEPIEAELVSELVSVAREHARAETYVFLGVVSVEMSTDPDLSPGGLVVTGDMKSAAAEGGGSASLILPDGSRRVLGATPVTIGRLPECEVVLGDANASRRHVEVRFATDGGGGYLAIDLGSTNGTKVNGVAIHTHRLRHGDEITIGSTHLRFEAP